MALPFDSVIFDSFIFESGATIHYGEDIRLGAGWKLGSTSNSNPGEYNPYTRQLPDASSPLFATEPFFGGGHFGLGQFGVGEFGWAPTFTDDVPYTPIYT